MTEVELYNVSDMEERHDVVRLYLKGTSVGTIAKDLRLTVAQVKAHLAAWGEVVKNDKGVKDRAYQAIANMTEHYNMIISDLWEVYEAAGMNDDYKIQATTLKSIADVEAKRVELLQKAGVIGDKQLGDEMAELEITNEKLKSLLMDTSAKCEHCRPLVAQGLAELLGRAQPIIIQDDNE